MEDTNKKSLITVIEIIVMLIVLYILAIYIQGYLDSLEAEMILTAIKTFAII